MAAAKPEYSDVLASAQRALGDLSNLELNYKQTKHAVEEYDGINVETDLHQSKEHFSKLKFNFIELETKKEFMLKTMAMQEADILSGIDPPEVCITPAKEALKAIKASNNELRDAMEAACEKFASGFDAYQTRLKQYAADVTSLELLAAEHQQLREKYTEQQEKFGAFDCTSVAELEDRCARAKEQQIAAEVELRNETAAVVALEAQIEALDAALLTADSARSAAAVGRVVFLLVELSPVGFWAVWVGVCFCPDSGRWWLKKGYFCPLLVLIGVTPLGFCRACEKPC
eukprot:m.251944 g.251944  ORF g.251944 m.251944 type:complete len:287 (+) comp19549_c0_seq7:147-1007(+)